MSVDGTLSSWMGFKLQQAGSWVEQRAVKTRRTELGGKESGPSWVSHLHIMPLIRSPAASLDCKRWLRAVSSENSKRVSATQVPVSFNRFGP